MKNIHVITAAAAALLLASCGSNDIVMTSEVGEKLIVERDTIRLVSTSKDDIQAWQEILKAQNGSGKYYCDGLSKKLCTEHLQEAAAIKHRVTLNEGPVWSQQWRYIPVMRDRNSKETVGEESFVTCYSPNFATKDKEILNGEIITRLTNYDTQTLRHSVARTICTEYPEWE